MKDHVQYIICDGKKPVDYRTRKVSNCVNDPGSWLSYQGAIDEAGDKYGVGFVLTREDRFFLVDLDKCIEHGILRSYAKRVLDLFPGAYVEVSQSGTGLHIIGTADEVPHSCKNIEEGIELYTSGRFVRLTGTECSGDAMTDCTVGLKHLIAGYFQPIDVQPQDWTIVPHEDWNGYSNDDELIENACKSSPFKRVRFEHLWVGEVPDDAFNGDRSSMDMSLASQLAFWTGNNCDRMLRLMWRSGLARDKWEREDYLQRTILKACSMNSEYHRKPGRPPASKEPVKPSEGALDFLKSCVFVKSLNQIFVPGEGLMKHSAFRIAYSGVKYPVTHDKCTLDVERAFRESELFEKQIVSDTFFSPHCEWGEIIEGRINTYKPSGVRRVKGDVSPFTVHIAKLFPDANDQKILISYLAACVQFPGVKFRWAPLIQGVQGNGKSLISEVLAHAIGYEYVSYPGATDLNSKFNGWLLDKLLVCVEDMYAPGIGNRMIESVKPLLTNVTQSIQFKGKDQFTTKIFANYIFNSNHKDAVRKHKDDRRFAIFYAAQQDVEGLERDGMDGKYFKALFEWLEGGGHSIVADYLQNYAISDKYNPATHCTRAPDTSSTAEAIVSSYGRIEEEIQEAVESGMQGFRGGYISTFALRRLFDDMGLKKKPKRLALAQIMKSMGYILAPQLTNGRSPSIIPSEGGQPKIYMLNTHKDMALESSSELKIAYVKAQGYSSD
jgi:hypothetical protein